MDTRLRNFIVIALTIVVCVAVQHIFVPVSKLLPPLMVRFVLGWGLALSVGVVCALMLQGTRIEQLILLLCVPIGWLLWYFVVIGVDQDARANLALYVLYSTGFMIIGFILGHIYRHMQILSRRP